MRGKVRLARVTADDRESAAPCAGGSGVSSHMLKLTPIRLDFGRLAIGLWSAWAAIAGLLPSAAAAERGVEQQAFATRGAERHETLFSTVAPEETGLRAFNAYDDPRMWAELYREFSLGAIGSGVAIGDYDADGRPDVFVARKTGENRLFRNLGALKFEDATERAGVAGPLGNWKQGATFADVDNDGDLDLYVCRFAAANLLYVNQGDGTFREEAAARGLALADASSMAAFCDYDRDGWLDAYVQTNLLDGERRPNGQRDRLYRNRGDGTFAEVTDEAGIRDPTQGHSATWWDFDDDGWPDLYVANDFKDPDQLYRNNGDGTFANVLSWVVPHTPHSSMGADLGDVDNDGRLDLLVADMAATTREKDHRGMAKLRVGLTEDEQRPLAAPQLMRNALFLNTGTGVMLEAAMLTGLDATDWTWSVRLEDLDNDGWLDAHFTNGMVRELHGADVLGRMMTKENMAERTRLMKATPVLSERNLAYRNRGDLKFENVSAAWGLDHLGVGFGAAFGDLDGDGDLDLVFTSMDDELTVCRNNSADGNAIAFALRGTVSNRLGVGAKVRIETESGVQVRTLTLARGYLSSSEPVLHFGVGEHTQVKRVTIDWPSGCQQTLRDLAANARYVVTEPSDEHAKTPAVTPSPRFVEITERAALSVPNHERPFNELKLQPLTAIRLNRPGPPLLVGRLDADEEDELVIGGVTGEAGRMFSNLGGGQFLAYGGSVFSDVAAVADGPMVTLDVDADGDLDLFQTKAGLGAPPDAATYQARVLLNDGTGRFTPAAANMVPSLRVSAGAVVAADFERSGRPAVFVGARLIPGQYPKTPRSALLAWRGDGLVDVVAEVAPTLAERGMVTAALWSDVDADGWIDLLVCYDWGQVRCFLNRDGKHLEDATDALGFSTAGNGWWRSLAAADFNGDGRMDYVAGNLGLNTPYRASEAEPVVLYAGVSIDGAKPQLIEAHVENGRWYPRRTRETLGRWFPSVQRRFPTAEAYAKATLEEVFPSDALQRTTKLTATELRSGVFMSQPDGTRRFVPLPRAAQIAPLHGTAAGDFDGDGRADILAVGNSYAPIPEVGRFDGGVGWFLRGDGEGGFKPEPAVESGVMVRRDARALAMIDFNRDGWPDFVASRNNDVPAAFLNQPEEGRNSFALMLRGPRGNPAAVGARVSVSLADGSMQLGEIAAGSGYFAQSTATLFFGYPRGAPPKEMRIRWPDGGEAVHSFDTPPSQTLRFTAP